MPILLFLIIGIGLYSLTITHTDASGVTRTGLQGLKVYLIPNFKGMTGKEFFVISDGCDGTAFLLDQRGDGNHGCIRLVC